jgi:hypothetical protein
MRKRLVACELRPVDADLPHGCSSIVYVTPADRGRGSLLIILLAAGVD